MPTLAFAIAVFRRTKRNAGSRQTFLYHLYDALVDFFNGAVAVDCDHTQRLTGGNFLIFVKDAAVESIVFFLKAVFIVAGGRDRTLVTVPCAGQRAIEIRQQQQG